MYINLKLCFFSPNIIFYYFFLVKGTFIVSSFYRNITFSLEKMLEKKIICNCHPEAMLIVLSCRSFLEIYSKKMKLLNAPGIFPLSRCSPTYVSISLRWELRLLLIIWGMRNILYNGILHCAFSIENFGFSTMNFIHSTSES